MTFDGTDVSQCVTVSHICRQLLSTDDKSYELRAKQGAKQQNFFNVIIWGGMKLKQLM
jgi:hypothetical protein